MLAAYYPPKGTRRDARKYHETAQTITNWLEARLDETPIRSTAIIGCDLNDTLKNQHDSEEGISGVGEFTGHGISGKVAKS